MRVRQVRGDYKCLLKWNFMRKLGGLGLAKYLLVSIRCPKFINSDLRASTISTKTTTSTTSTLKYKGVQVQALYGILIASWAHNLCKSSQGLTLSTVSLALFRNMSKIKYKQLANIRFRMHKICSDD